MGGGFSKNKSKSSQSSQAGTVFPTDFLYQGSQMFGRPLTLDEYVGMMPSTRSVFGGPSYGIRQADQGPSPSDFGGYGPQGYGPYEGGYGTGAPYYGGGFSKDRGGPGGSPSIQSMDMGGPNGGPSITMNRQPDGSHGPPAGGTGLIAGQAPKTVTPEQATQSYSQFAPWKDQQTQEQAWLQSHPGQRWEMTPAPQGPRFAGGGNANAAIERTGIGGYSPEYQSAFQPFYGGDYNRLEGALYSSVATPQIRELQRQQDLNTAKTKAELAGAGLASSGTGFGQLQRQGREYEQRQTQVAADAAAEAAKQRYGLEAQQRQFAAEDIGRAQELSQQARTQGQQAAMQLMGVSQDDLKRMDARDLQMMDMIGNYWQKVMGVAGEAGRYSTGQGSASSSGLSLWGSYGSGK